MHTHTAAALAAALADAIAARDDAYKAAVAAYNARDDAYKAAVAAYNARDDAYKAAAARAALAAGLEAERTALDAREG